MLPAVSITIMTSLPDADVVLLESSVPSARPRLVRMDAGRVAFGNEATRARCQAVGPDVSMTETAAKPIGTSGPPRGCAALGLQECDFEVHAVGAPAEM